MNRKLSRRDFIKVLGPLSLGGVHAQVRGRGLPRLGYRDHSSSSAEAANVLLIVLDTVRAQSLSLNGYERETSPQLERLARRGLSFENAISTSPWTLPGHASMFTGRYPHEVSADWSVPLDATFPTLAEVLASNGYATAGFVANVGYCSYEHGLNRGFAYYSDYQFSLGQFILSSSLGRTVASSDRLRRISGYHELLNRRTAENINNDFLHWLSTRGRQPFFAFLNYYDAHEP